MSPHGWIGVDLDGTLAYYDKWVGDSHIGAPVPKMLERVKRWLAEGQEVRIMTARARSAVAVKAIEAWCLVHVGQVLAVTDRKDYQMVQLWDDRCVQVRPNTGERVTDLRVVE